MSQKGGGGASHGGRLRLGCIRTTKGREMEGEEDGMGGEGDRRRVVEGRVVEGRGEEWREGGKE